MEKHLEEAPYPFQAHLGFEITEWKDRFCRIEQPMLDHLGNRYGIPHGGVYATLLDAAMGFCVCYTGDRDHKQLVMTLNLNINYLSVAKGTTLIATGRQTGGGRSTAFAEGDVRDENNTIIATAAGVFRYRGTKQKAP